jgi:hypothetical protein
MRPTKSSFQSNNRHIVRMNIRQQLLKKHSRENADFIESHAIKSQASVIELMACFLGEETKVVQRASQVVGNLGRHHPEMLKPWWEEMISAGDHPVHVAVRRNVARYFCELNLTLPEQLEKKIIDSFTRWSTSSDTPVAVAVFAMQFIADRCSRYPKQAKAIAAAIESRIDSASPGFKNRGQKILKQIALPK